VHRKRCAVLEQRPQLRTDKCALRSEAMRRRRAASKATPAMAVPVTNENAPSRWKKSATSSIRPSSGD
jgi:hypothetical protein